MIPKEDLVAIRIRVGIGVGKGGKRAIFPAFNNLPGTVRGDMDWSTFVDVFGTGLEYDNVAGYGKVDAYSTERMKQFVCTCIPSEFAVAAAAMFPEDVKIIDEAGMEIFYNERAHADSPEELADNERLQTIALKKQLDIVLSDEDNDALDPLKDTKGLRINPNKTWARHKVEHGLDRAETFNVESAEAL